MLSIIVALSENGVIGDKNALLWDIKEDMRHFRQKTTGHTIIMGRKTYESIGRPLPNRRNVVITRQNIEIEGCTTVHSLEEAVALVKHEEEAFIIGGEQIYRQALALVDRLYLTRVHRHYDGDACFPAIVADEWEQVSIEEHPCGENFEHGFSFVEMKRRK